MFPKALDRVAAKLFWLKSRRRGLPISAFASFELSKVPRKSFYEHFLELGWFVLKIFIARGDPMPQPLHGAAYAGWEEREVVEKSGILKNIFYFFKKSSLDFWRIRSSKHLWRNGTGFHGARTVDNAVVCKQSAFSRLLQKIVSKDPFEKTSLVWPTVIVWLVFLTVRRKHSTSWRRSCMVIIFCSARFVCRVFFLDVGSFSRFRTSLVGRR